MTKVLATTQAELDALELEGIFPATIAQELLIQRGRELQEAYDEAERNLKAVKDELEKSMDAVGAKSLLVAGKKAAERVTVNETERFNAKEFAAKNPEVVTVWMVPKAGYSYVKLV